MSTQLKITRSELGTKYLLNSRAISLTQMGNYIREGSTVSVRDSNGYDMTKETLVKIAFEDVFSHNIKSEYITVISEFIDERDLLMVIENGGYDSFVQRRSRKAIFEGSYYFDKIESSLLDYVKSGKNKEEMRNYLGNLIEGVL